MPASLFSPVALLVQWSLLLALGWGLHVVLPQRHPRWRLILWRSVLVLSVLLPLFAALQLPRLSVEVPDWTTSSANSPVTATDTFRVDAGVAAGQPAGPRSTLESDSTGSTPSPSREFPWAAGAVFIWLVGVAGAHGV